MASFGSLSYEKKDLLKNFLVASIIGEAIGTTAVDGTKEIVSYFLNRRMMEGDLFGMNKIAGRNKTKEQLLMLLGGTRKGAAFLGAGILGGKITSSGIARALAEYGDVKTILEKTGSRRKIPPYYFDENGNMKLRKTSLKPQLLTGALLGGLVGKTGMNLTRPKITLEDVLEMQENGGTISNIIKRNI